MNSNQPKPFSVLLRVRYSECDAQGVLFNSRYAELADVAITEYFRELFGSYQQLLERGFDSQVVKLSTEWLASARFDDVLRLEVSTEKLGNSSYRLRVDYLQQQSDFKIASSEITYVMVNSETMRPSPIPDDIKQILAPGAAGIEVNQAGQLGPAG